MDVVVYHTSMYRSVPYTDEYRSRDPQVLVLARRSKERRLVQTIGRKLTTHNLLKLQLGSWGHRRGRLSFICKFHRCWARVSSSYVTRSRTVLVRRSWCTRSPRARALVSGMLRYSRYCNLCAINIINIWKHQCHVAGPWRINTEAPSLKIIIHVLEPRSELWLYRISYQVFRSCD